MKRVVISTKTVDKCLLRGRFVSDHPVRFAILWNGLRLGCTRDSFREFGTVCFGTEIERRALERKSKIDVLAKVHARTKIPTKSFA